MKTTRRNFIKQSTLSTAMIGGGLSALSTTFNTQVSGKAPKAGQVQKSGAQRLPLEKLKKWESLEYGMFIHFGMSTFTGNELDSGNAPSSLYNPWFKVKDYSGDEKDYYIPGEVCDPIGYEWFWKEEDKLRSIEELLGMRLIANARGTNLLLDVPPDKTGKIPKATVNALMTLQKKYSQIKSI